MAVSFSCLRAPKGYGSRPAPPVTPPVGVVVALSLLHIVQMRGYARCLNITRNFSPLTPPAAAAWSSSAPPLLCPTTSTERTKQAPVCICEQYLSTVGICCICREGVGRKKLVLEADWPTGTIRCYPVHSLQSLAHTAAHPPAWEQPTGEHRCFPAKFSGRGAESCATVGDVRRNNGVRSTTKWTNSFYSTLSISALHNE